jgi:CBS domain-containing membrane protein
MIGVNRLRRWRLKPYDSGYDPETGTRELKVGDIMSSDVFTLMHDDNVRVLEALMEWRGIRHVPIIDAEENVVGIITQRDFLKLAISNLSGIDHEEASNLYEAIPVNEVMTRNVLSVEPDTPLSVAAQLMFQRKFGCLPVLLGNKLVGIITEADFVKAFYSWDIRGSANAKTV